jgi:glutamyl-tRNA(Gln) amidotransferase subunit D
MTYSREIIDAMKKSGARVGDRVAAGSYEGLLMPSPELVKDSPHLVLKLDNGYNVGIHFTKETAIEKRAAAPPASAKTAVKRVSEPKRAVSLLAVGGTIASRVDYTTGGVSAAMTPEDFTEMVPELAGIAKIDMFPVSDAMSEDLAAADWISIAKEAEKALKKNEGVIITHGTDIMHYTSAALSFMLTQPGKPVVITGAQRSSDRGSADGAMNLICSAHAALSDIAEVGICMHAEPNDSFAFFTRGTKVRKMHSTMRNTFRPINDYPLAKIWPDGKIEALGRSARKRGPTKTSIVFEDKIALLKAYPGSDPKLLEHVISSGVKGVVVEGTGMGHVPTKAKKSWIPAITDAIKSGVPVVIGTQCIYGAVNTDVYSNLRILYHEAGAIPAGDMTPETAYVKLGWVLAQEKRLAKVREMMATNYVGELNDRLEPDMFLY